MATSAPEQEEEKKALFGPDYDENKSLHVNPDPKDNKATGDPSDPRGSNPLTPSDIADKEKSATGDPSADIAGKSGLYSGKEKGGKLTLRGRLTRNVKRRATVGIIAGVLGIGGIAGFGIIQGPLKIMHFSQLLQRHFASNEDFGDSRLGRTMYHLFVGGGIQRSRLGIAGNKAADKWENRMAKDTGLRPVYDKTTGKLRGYQVVDGLKANNLTGNGGKDLNKNYSDKAKMLNNVNENAGFVDKNGNPAKGQIIDLSDANYNDRRKAIKTMVRATSMNKLTSTMATRLLKKRAGVKFHWMNKAEKRADDKIISRREAREKRKEEEKNKNRETVKDGANQAEGTKAGTNSEGKSDPADEAVNGESKNIIRDFMSKGVIKTGMAGTAVVGVLCMAKSFGKDVDKYKYENNYLPMLRIGAMFLSSGDQARAFDDFDMESLEIMNDYMEQNGEQWYQAESLVAEDGGTGGKPVPKEADLKNVGDRPQFFNILDGIPGLGSACGIQDAIFGLPGIKHVMGAVGDVTSWMTDRALSVAGTSSEELMTSALKMVAGSSVDLDGATVTGADIGNFANIGAFAASNESIIAQGGSPLTDAEVAELKQQETEDTEQKSFYAKYLDPYSYNTVTAKAIDRTNATTLANFFGNPFKNLGSLLNPVFSGVSAQTTKYDYGIPKYGFSLELQQDPRFEDPNENALIVEGPDGSNLQTLNDKYSKCFGTKVIADDSGIKIETETDREKLNIFKQSDDCKNNNSEEFLRYRFYIADTIATLSLACYEGDDNSCGNLNGQEVPDNAQTNTDSGAEADISIMATDSDHIPCYPGTKDLGIVQSKFRLPTIVPSGNATKLRLCQIPTIPGNGNNTSGVEISGGAVVASPISKAWYTLGKDAKEAGINLRANSSFRLADSCNGTGDGTYCAKPGMSMHQSGLAIDFADMDKKGSNTTTCSPRTTMPESPQWSWMYENAEKYGLYQYTAEAWHWDPAYPIGNRCNKAGASDANGVSAFNTNSSGQDSSTPGNIKELAQKMLELKKQGKIVFTDYSESPVSDRNDRSLASLQVEDMALGKLPHASTRCSNNPGASSTVNPDIKILQFLVDLASTTTYKISALFGQCHSTGSTHYSGKAIDFDCPLDTTKADSIAGKHGVKRYSGEACGGNGNHWHYSTTGN